jgi:hypothetical protein
MCINIRARKLYTLYQEIEGVNFRLANAPLPTFVHFLSNINQLLVKECTPKILASQNFGKTDMFDSFP